MVITPSPLALLNYRRIEELAFDLGKIPDEEIPKQNGDSDEGMSGSK